MKVLLNKNLFLIIYSHIISELNIESYNSFLYLLLTNKAIYNKYKDLIEPTSNALFGDEKCSDELGVLYDNEKLIKLGPLNLQHSGIALDCKKLLYITTIKNTESIHIFTSSMYSNEFMKFNTFKQLTNLAVTNSNLKKLPLLDLPLLESLNLFSNKICNKKKITGEKFLEKLPRIEFITLNNNLIQTFYFSGKIPPKVKYFDIMFNKLSEKNKKNLREYNTSKLFVLA